LYCEIALMYADAVLRQQGRKVHAGYTDDLPAVWVRPRKPSQLAVTASQQHRCRELQLQKAHVFADIAHQPSAYLNALLGVSSTFQWPSTGFKRLQFSTCCRVYLHYTGCQKFAHQKLRLPALGFDQSTLAAHALKLISLLRLNQNNTSLDFHPKDGTCAADEQGKQYSSALGAFSCAGSCFRCQHCPSTSPSRPPGSNPQHLPSPSTIPYLLHAWQLTLPNPLHSQSPQGETTRRGAGGLQGPAACISHLWVSRKLMWKPDKKLRLRLRPCGSMQEVDWGQAQDRTEHKEPTITPTDSSPPQ